MPTGSCHRDHHRIHLALSEVIFNLSQRNLNEEKGRRRRTPFSINQSLFLTGALAASHLIKRGLPGRVLILLRMAIYKSNKVVDRWCTAEVQVQVQVQCTQITWKVLKSATQEFAYQWHLLLLLPMEQRISDVSLIEFALSCLLHRLLLLVCPVKCGQMGANGRAWVMLWHDSFVATVQQSIAKSVVCLPPKWASRLLLCLGSN